MNWSSRLVFPPLSPGVYSHSCCLWGESIIKCSGKPSAGLWGVRHPPLYDTESSGQPRAGMFLQGRQPTCFCLGVLQVHNYQCFPVNTGKRWAPKLQLSGAKPIRLPGGICKLGLLLALLNFPTLVVSYEEIGLPRWLNGKELACQCRRRKRHGFDPWVRKIPWRKAWQPTPVFLPCDPWTGSQELEASLVAQRVKICLHCRRPGFNPWVGKIPWRREVATHCKILAWRIPWTEEPGRLQSLGLQRVGHDWAT